VSRFIIRPLEPHEFDTWDEFVAESPQGNLFHTSTWKRIIDRAYAPAHVLLLGCFDGHNLAGGCVVLDRTRLGHRTAVTPLLTPYVGFLLELPIGEKVSDQVSRQNEVVGSLAKWLGQTFVLQNLINAPRFDDTRPLQQAGYTLTPRFTYYLNVKLPPEELWQRFDGSVRRQIRKAERDNLEITTQFDLHAAYEMVHQTYVRRGEVCPVTRELFEAVAEGEALRDNRQVICAWRDGKLASFIVLLTYRRTLYYAAAATDADMLSSGVSSLLIWEVVKAFANQEWNDFDFVGANIPSIARFKEGFNPKLMLHFQAEMSSRYARIGKNLAKLIRK
jgi:hypothetical protein